MKITFANGSTVTTVGRGSVIKGCTNMCNEATEIHKLEAAPTPEVACTKKGRPIDTQRIKKEFIKKTAYVCSNCGISHWCGAPLILHIHHKDGERKNNEESNLCLLCPNCHSQTKTWCGKKLAGAKRPDLSLRNTTPEMREAVRVRMREINPMHNPEHRKTQSAVMSDGRLKGEKHWAYGMKRPEIAERNRQRAGKKRCEIGGTVHV